MAKITLATLTSNFASVANLNANFAAIVTAFENTLSRDGTATNTMTADLDMNSNAILNASSITLSGTPSVFVQGKPANSDVVWYYSAVHGFTIPAGAGGHKSHGRVASTGTVVFDVLKNDSSIGSVTFTASSTGVWSITTAQTIVAGDRLSLTAPAAQDATLEDISFTFLVT